MANIDRRTFNYLMTLLESMPPPAWREEIYVESPYITIENLDGELVLSPSRKGAEIILNNIQQSLGLVKKRDSGNNCYVVVGADVAKALQIFQWLVRRSWKRKDITALWALIYVAKVKGWGEKPIPLSTVAELSLLEPELCTTLVQETISRNVGGGKLTVEGNECISISKSMVEEALRALLTSIPTWSEELVMNSLCSRPNSSVADIYKQLSVYGFSIRSIYKLVEKLKAAGFIVRLRYQRVSPKGPMREILAANCQNCFYGYTTQERCFQDTFRQVEAIMSRRYGKELNTDERMKLYKSLTLIPYSSRILRRILTILQTMEQVDRFAKEAHIMTVLKKFEEAHGVKFS
jgi:hypothetical protein